MVERATDKRASLGQRVNQSMVQQLTKEGKLRRRMRNMSPIGLMASTMCRYLRQLFTYQLNTSAAVASAGAYGRLACRRQTPRGASSTPAAQRHSLSVTSDRLPPVMRRPSFERRAKIGATRALQGLLDRLTAGPPATTQPGQVQARGIKAESHKLSRC